MISPFDATGVTRRPDGIKRYEGLPRSLVHMLRNTVEHDPQREALAEIGGGPRLTYGELWDRAARVAGGLRAAGIGRGDRVAIHLGNGVDWVLAFFGTVLAGGIVVPVNTRLAEDEVNYVVTDSGAAYVFREGGSLPDGEPYVTDDLAPQDAAAIFYTSGTTGFPKGAITTHENFLSNCETCRRILRLDIHGSGLRTLVSVPLFHVTGCNSQLLVAVYLGGTTVIMPQFEVGAFLEAIEAERIDVLTTVPAIYWLAINHPRFPRDRPVHGDHAVVRWRTDRTRPRRPDHEGVSGGTRRKRFRAHRNVQRHDLPTARVRCARRLSRLSRAGLRRPRRPARWGRRRGASRPRAQRRCRLLEQAGGDRRDVRRRLAAYG